ncbi:MAG TPA: Ig-like domain-containing protein [Bryobacteraceae bacterium]|nr:Ig-like domain-containing protein [Bryobacteraceae bacterium]
MIKEIQLADCFQAGGVKLERVKYFQRQLLTVDDMVTDQDYFRQKMRRHNRFLHGWGVVCGLDVTAAPIAGAPWRVQIGAGYALGPFGDEIYVAEPAFLDLAKCGPGGSTDPCDPTRSTGSSGAGGTVYAAIQYAECFSSPVRAMASMCGCGDDGCEYSRIRDGFSLGCLTALPPVEATPLICDLRLRRVTAPCPPCPSSPWVALASVTLPASTSAVLADAAINITVRKALYRTELLQAQLISCCCGQAPVPVLPQPVPVKVTNVNPADGSFFANNGPSTVVLTFSKSLQPATANSGSVIVAGSNGQPVAGAVTYDDSTHIATFAAAGGRGLLPDTYTVTAKGTGTAPIKDTDNLVLNGGSSDFTSKIIVDKMA